MQVRKEMKTKHCLGRIITTGYQFMQWTKLYFSSSQRNSHYEDEEPFCCVLWLKIVFLSGFALSQFSIGSIVEKFGSWATLRFAAKTLIISGMIASNAGKIFKSF